ncbi:MAG: hypothetical protein DMG88_10125 [Acidobacteria bacterium]|nr:MAG: hypothetical protein DMG88_10125 [Acidobacteriota bacterium]
MADAMFLLFKEQIQSAIRNRLQTIELLLKAPYCDERDERIEEHVHMIGKLLVLEPAPARAQVSAQSSWNRIAQKN